MSRATRSSSVNLPLAALVRRDVFGETDAAESAYLRSDEMAERWLVELTRVAASILAQIEGHTSGVRVRDDNWHHAAKHLWARYNDRIVEAKRLVGDIRARLASGDLRALRTEVDRLRGAIRAHETASAAAEVEPEPWDTELWAHVQRRDKNRPLASAET